MSIEVKKGPIDKVKCVKHVYGDRDSGTITTFIAHYQLDQKAMIAKSFKSHNLDNHDELIVAGKPKNDGSFNVLAYYNKTKGLSNERGMLYFLVGLLFTAAIATFLSWGYGHNILHPTLVIIAFCAIGIYLIPPIFQAKRLVNQHKNAS